MLWQDMDLQKSANRTVLFTLEGQRLGRPLIDWCDQLAKASQSADAPGFGKPVEIRCSCC